MSSLIFNYYPSDLSGIHWVAAWISESVYWFDSFGMPPDADDIIIGHQTFFKEWLTKICKSMILKSYSWNTLDLQNMWAKTCGHYSLYFCKKMDLSKTGRILISIQKIMMLGFSN